MRGIVARELIMPWKTLTFVTLAASFAWIGGCVYDNEPPRRLGGDPTPTSPAPPASATSSSSSSGGAGAPLLVEIDTDQTMDAVGGDGVGVFIEYQKGGHWHLWWTCDTNKTHQACELSVSATAMSGSITNFNAAELAGGFATTPTPSRVEASSTTTTEVHGVRFDTDPGAIITVDASLGGLKDGSFLFFVQDGKVNGGFAGVLTNPIQVQGTTP